MGLLDSIIAGAMRGGLGQSQTQALPNILTQLLGRTDLGNIGGLLAALQQGGLDRQVASWLGNGANMPVNPGQLRSAIGEERLQQMAGAAGVPLDQLLSALTQHLPGTIDRMSPHGALEDVSAEDEDTGANQSGGSLEDQAGLKDIR